VWLYPSFIVTCVLVVVAWQFALLAEFRVVLAVTLALVIALGAIQCTGETNAMTVVVAVSCGGFQLFAFCAAQLLRSEITARERLARAHAELKATQVLLSESARMGERLRIARDLHDVMGDSLSSLTIHLDVASRLTTGPAAEHLSCARAVSGELLEQVRSVVSRFRVPPIDLRAALQSLADSVKGLDVRVVIAKFRGSFTLSQGRRKSRVTSGICCSSQLAIARSCSRWSLHIRATSGSSSSSAAAPSETYAAISKCLEA
jgi:signal transduction histidine kinase